MKFPLFLTTLNVSRLVIIGSYLLFNFFLTLSPSSSYPFHLLHSIFSISISITIFITVSSFLIFASYLYLLSFTFFFSCFLSSFLIIIFLNS